MAMPTLPRRITGGVDTHLDVHVVAALDELGTLLGVESFSTTAAGYRKTLRWLRSFGTVELVGVEATGSYGAGLTRHLLGEAIAVVEVDRPNRQRRRKRGKSAPQDAITAARASQSGDALGAAQPPTRGVGAECASALLVAAGDNPERLRSEATFAHLCGVAPLDASSGKQERHRLNRGGDRQANAALWRIVMARIVYDPRTKRYINRRMR